VNDYLRKLLKPLASLRLTVVLLALSIVLVFAGTWAQIDHDVWTVQKRYFHSFFTWVNFAIFLPRPAPGQTPIPGGFPMPGGYTLIALLLANLIAAHSVRFKFTLKRTGILLIHAGLILLILGEVVTSVYQVEGQMLIHEGETVNFAADARQAELAVIDTSPADHNIVTANPAARLVKHDTISYPTLPFSIKVEKYLPNSAVLGPFQAKQAGAQSPVKATAGAGQDLTVVEQPKLGGTADEASKVDAPSAFVTLTATDGRNLGTYLASTWMNQPQQIELDGKGYQLDLRWRRFYKPYSITLLDFKHDRYTGTNTPRNFSSRVRLVDPSRNEDREVLIWMNHPLRYAGETFYQSGFDEQADRFTILQVVRNPGWLIPYVSCSVVTLGLLIHFGQTLLGFLKRRGSLSARAEPARNSGRPGSRQYVLKPKAGVMWPALVTAACAIYLLSAGRPPNLSGPFDLNSFGRVPLSYEGRVMPLDTLARTSLRILSGRSDFKDSEGKSQPAIQWLIDTLADAPKAAAQKVFRIDHPDLKGVLNLDANRKLFAIDDLIPAQKQFAEQHARAEAVAAKGRNLYQKAVIELGNHITLFNRLAGVETLFFAPPTAPGEEWKTIGEASSESQTGRVNPGLRAIASMIDSYRANQPESFNAITRDYLDWVHSNLPSVARRAKFEVLFNYFEPFIHCMTLYVGVFLLVCASWLFSGARPTLQRTAFWVMTLALIFHTLGLAARIYIQGRPPVTNLYSSAVFIGWAVVVFCACIERIYRNGVGMLAASIIAFPTLLIAHYLAGSGDTMQMLQAVLDTNIWLATHVVVITLGYAATFLAGIIAAIYVIGGLFTRVLADDDNRKTLSRMIYGVVCFAMLFSFVGTILGGIWADQSWGRFWGWDPKENGAVLIVLWNAIILHARWGGLVRDRGLACLAVFGNVVTAWSWFGTNMLGVGLHSYGFMDSAVFWLGLFIAIQLGLIAAGNLPAKVWRSFARQTN
jgi:ABC-type transport system involved in cytochrome c biogenesis permease subunit